MAVSRRSAPIYNTPHLYHYFKANKTIPKSIKAKIKGTALTTKAPVAVVVLTKLLTINLAGK